MSLLGAAAGDAPIAFVEIGVVMLLLAVLARLADRFALTAVPLYLLAGLAIGESRLDVSRDFIQMSGEIGVLLLLLALGLEYSPQELVVGLRTGAGVGVVDFLLGFLPGLVLGLVLGWEVTTAILLGGVSWVSSSGVISKVLADLDRLGNRETPAVLNLLVFEDLAMVVYLPVVAALLACQPFGRTVTTVVVALAVAGFAFLVSLRWGDRLSAFLHPASDEALLLSVFGLTLAVGGLAQRLQVSAAIGAFLVGLALSGPVRHRAASLVTPLRDVFAAAFFVFFSVQIEPSSLPAVAVPALGLFVVTAVGKVAVGWMAARRAGVAAPGRVRAGTVLIARGEFSIVIAALGASMVDGPELGALAAGYVLLTALVAPLLTKHADALAARFAPAPAPQTA